MKKLLLGLVLISGMIASSCHKKGTTSKQKLQNLKDSSKLSNVRVTLTGIPYVEADTMVSRFRKNRTSSDPITAIWLSKDWVDAVADLLEEEPIADGFRIYFAKRQDGKNTVVIVSTMDDGPDNSESGADHLDYFSHSMQFSSAIAKLPFIEDYTGDPGATLFTSPPTTCATGCFPGAINNNIKCDEAFNAVQNLKKDPLINTNSEWFPIDLISSLRDELDYAADTLNKPVDGIRIYFAKNIESATNQKHKNRHSFIVVTTQKVRNVPRVDYYTCYNPNNPGHKFASDTSKFTTTDNGEQCLNNCNGATLPAN